jgi:hypothetical protein
MRKPAIWCANGCAAADTKIHRRIFKILKKLLVTLCLLGFAATAAAQMSAEEARQQAETLQRQYSGEGGATQAMPEAVTLTEKDIANFMGVLPALKDLGMSSELMGTDPQNVGELMSFNQKAMGVLNDFGFSPQTFQQVSYSIGLAIAGLESKGRESEIEAATAQREQMLKQMEGQLSEEQINMLRQQLDQAMGMLGEIQEQPPGNMSLVEKYKDQLMALLNSM